MRASGRVNPKKKGSGAAVFKYRIFFSFLYSFRSTKIENGRDDNVKSTDNRTRESALLSNVYTAATAAVPRERHITANNRPRRRRTSIRIRAYSCVCRCRASECTRDIVQYYIIFSPSGGRSNAKKTESLVVFFFCFSLDGPALIESLYSCKSA